MIQSERRFFMLMTCHYLDQPGSTFVLVVQQGKFASTNQKHYPDLGTDTSSVWGFCAHFADVILQGNYWWHREMLAVFSQARRVRKDLSLLF